MGRRFGFCSHPEAAIVKMNLLPKPKPRGCSS
jgi:hypothetical protein